VSRFAGKSFLVVGGGTGIGAACARGLAAEGARVAVLGRRLGPLEEVSRAIGGLALAADAADRVAMDAAIAQVVAAHGGLDGLVVCSGGHGVGAAGAISDDDWHDAFRSNLSSALVATRAALPPLLGARGAVVYVASIAALAAGPEVCGYTTFKHALVGLTRSVARDYGRLGLRANAVCPGWVRTPMADAEMQPLMAARGLTLDQAYAQVTRDVPLGRAAEPEEIADVCLFLASAQASMVTGAVLTVDRGSTIVDVPTLALVKE
jgi:meso-butanediol dehydrogenase/(S,S)-butanediol dehydrogenase/diacetyl reductase